MGLQHRFIEYRDGDVLLEGRLARDDQFEGARPGVLIAHAWSGRSDYEDSKADALARLGYAAFALDLYGKGVRGSNPEENAALMQPFLDDREMLQRRLLVALETLREQPEVDAARVAAIGFCFGGLCVLDIARSGADEMTALGADWQLHAYGNRQHAFTNPAANDPARGTVYDEAADRRSWQAMANFLDELFGG